MKKLIPLLFVTAVLSACTTAPAPEPKGDADSAALLATAIGRVEQASPSTASADARAKPAQLVGDVSVNFIGEARDLLKQMSAARALGFRVYGPQPHLPLFVVVDVKNVSFEQFLTDVGAQFGQRADLVLTNESIEVRYRD